MAENENIYRPMEVFWTLDETDAEEVLGSRKMKPNRDKMKDPGNRRPLKPSSQIKGKKTREVKAGMPKKQPVVEDVTPKQNPHTNSFDILGDGKTSQKASLKDLCAEDKKRVANLVKELARLGDERENTLQQLHSERKMFERRVADLQKEQSNIMKDKEDVSGQLSECQTLLSRYHQYMKDQEDSEPAEVSHHPHPHTPNEKIPHSRRSVEMYTPKSRSSEFQRQNVFTSPKQHKPHGINAASQRTPHSKNHPQLHQDSVPRAGQDLNGAFSEMKPHTPHRLPPSTANYHVHPSLDGASVSDRPFTNKIDQIIAEEKQTVPEITQYRDSDMLPLTHGGNVAYRQSLPDRRLPGLGPLNPPALSSTQRSDYSHSEDIPRPMQEFHPLQPDSSLRSSTQSLEELPRGTHFSARDGNNNAKVGFASPVQTAAHSPPQDEQHFMEYYSTLGPEERKHQLQAQKQQLLDEQRRLKSILSEQEEMLKSKQDQLHKQQEIQQDRLKYFEQMGAFPQYHQYNAAAPAPQPHPGSEQITAKIPDHLESQLMSLLGQITQLRGLNEAEQYKAVRSDQSFSAQTSDSEQSRPRQTAGSAPVSEVPSRRDPHNNKVEDHTAGLPAQYLYARPSDRHGGLPQSTGQFLEQDAPETRPPGKQEGGGVGKTRPTVSSSVHQKPRREQKHPEPSHHKHRPPGPPGQKPRSRPLKQEGIWLDEEGLPSIFNDGDPIHDHSASPNIFKQPKLKPSRIPTYNKTSELYDLVNEVESELESMVSQSRDTSFTIHTPSDLHPGTRPSPRDLYTDDDEAGSYMGQGAALDGTDDEAEESQVLEDIFFVK